MGKSMIEGIEEIPRVNYDKESDTLYIFVKEGTEEEFVEVTEGILLELNNGKEIIGIEILNASKIFEPLLSKKSIP
jgi:uncharacterized protein YuzE